VTTSAPRVVLLRDEGEVYTPVMAGARVLELAELAALAAAPGDRPDVARWFCCVLLDEMELEGGWRHDLASLATSRCRVTRLPLVLGDSGLRIGDVETIVRHPPEAVPGVVGSCLVATGRFGTTKLAEIAWTAVQAGILRGVCIELDAEETEPGLRALSTLRAVRLGDLESGHVPGARVLASWEEPAFAEGRVARGA